MSCGETVHAGKRLVSCLLAAAGFSQLACGVEVTVAIAAQSGDGVPKDAIVVFEPLDAMPPPTRASAVVDQVDKQFKPQVSVVRTGTAVSFPNGDQIKHEVYSAYPPKQFELKLYAGRPSQPVVFDKPGLETLGCNVHDKMIAFIGIVDSPYFTTVPRVSGTGKATLDVPAGRYSVRVWHPDLAARVAARSIEVKTDRQTVMFTLDLSTEPDPVNAWPFP
jgi:plastocyanin